MRFELEIEMTSSAFDHDAFGLGRPNSEVARILRVLADGLEDVPGVRPGDAGGLWDVNGNKTGEWRVHA